LRTWQEAGILDNQTRRIQNAANKTGQRITVVGSRAAGTSNSLSDWDYILSGQSRQRGKVKKSVPKGVYGGEDNRGRDIWQDYNPQAPGYTVLRSDDPHVIFDPK